MWTLEGGSRLQAADEERRDASRESRTREVEALVRVRKILTLRSRLEA